MKPEVIMATLAFFSPGPWQFVIVLLVVLVLFGTRLPSIMRSLGVGITEFRKGIKGEIDVDGNSAIENQGEDKAETKEKATPSASSSSV